jgi:hypothetical protein
LAQGNVAQRTDRGVVISPGAVEDYNENINPIYYDDNVDPDNNNDFNYPVQPSSNQGKSICKKNVWFCKAEFFSTFKEIKV